MEKIIKNHNNEAVSAVIGVILMVAITVAIAATVYVYTSGLFNEESQTTPIVTMIAKSSQDKNYGLITIVTTDQVIHWNDVSGVIYNNTGNYKIQLDDGSGWKLLATNGGKITAGTVIEIRNNIDLESSQNFQTGNSYTFTLIHKPTNGIMGTVTWIH